MEWIRCMVEDYVHNKVARNHALAQSRLIIEKQVVNGEITPTIAAEHIINRMEELLFTTNAN